MAGRVYGVGIWTGPKSNFLAEAHSALTGNSGKTAVLHTVNPEILVNAWRNPDFKNLLNQGNWNTVDGVGLQIALQRKGVTVPERLCGSDLIYDLAKLCSETHRPLYFIGGMPQRLAKAIANLQALYPGLVVEGVSPKPGQGLDFVEMAQVKEDLRRLRPGVIAVCLGSPRQEQWIWHHKALLDGCGVGLAGGLGGTVDFVSGEVERAPMWVRKMGVEWLYRLLKNPSRLRRQMSALPIFGLCALTGYKIEA